MRLDSRVVFEPLDKLLISFENKLDREWPPHLPTGDSSSLLLHGFVAIASNTFKTIRYICADTPPDPLRKLEYARAAPALSRVILEILFNVTFMLEDLPARVAWFEKAGWLAMWEDLQRLRQAYGSDAEWTENLAEREARLEAGRAFLGLSEAEAMDPRGKISRWPLRQKMADRSPALRAHLTFLGDWFYKNLSEDAHVSWLGFVRHSVVLLNPTGKDLTERVQNLKYELLTTTTALLLALLSEIELGVGLNLAQRLEYVWGLVRSAPQAREIYDRRYAGRLRSAPIAQ
jgi:hypothetical protein